MSLWCHSSSASSSSSRLPCRRRLWRPAHSAHRADRAHLLEVRDGPIPSGTGGPLRAIPLLKRRPLEAEESGGWSGSRGDGVGALLVVVLHVAPQGASVTVALVTADELAGEWLHTAMRHHVTVAKQQCNTANMKMWPLLSNNAAGLL